VPALLAPTLVDEVIEACGRTQRRMRSLPARVALYFVLTLWFCPGAGYAEVRVLFRRHCQLVGCREWWHASEPCCDLLGCLGQAAVDRPTTSFQVAKRAVISCR
jgi:transposase IS4-like protein